MDGERVPRMKGLISLVLILFCHLFLISRSSAQTRTHKKQPLQERLSGTSDFSAQAAFLRNFKAPQRTLTRKQRQDFYLWKDSRFRRNIGSWSARPRTLKGFFPYPL